MIENILGAAKPLINASLLHPFNRELAAGTLAEETFIFYLIQDSLYLADFARALTLTAARLPSLNDLQQFIHFAEGAIESEQGLHKDYLTRYLPKNTNYALIKQGPACFMYTNYLLRTAALATVEEATAALLPCFYIYHELGKNMLTSQKPDHPYQAWITLYASPDFAKAVNQSIDIVDSLGTMASPGLQEKMIQAFCRSSQLEWLFWQSAYVKEQWTI